MARQTNDRRFSPRYFPPLILSVLIYVCLGLLLPGALARQESTQEVAANLAEGRVVICVAKDGIVVATADAPTRLAGGHSELGSRPPVLQDISGLRAGVLLGAVEWVQPESKDKPVRLDGELPSLLGPALNDSGYSKYENSASDIEAIGVALLERVRQLAGQLHNKIDIGEDEPLIRLVLIGYVPHYGPEAWTIDYHIRQDAIGNDYWQTRVLRPSYYQLYPPEKGRPHTLMEVSYPPASRATPAPELLDLLLQNDPRLVQIRAADEIIAKSVALVVDGQSQKSLAASDADFLRAALPAVTLPETKLTMAVIDFDRGFRWVIEPPAAERPPKETTAPQGTPQQEENAPSLRHPHPY